MSVKMEYNIIKIKQTNSRKAGGINMKQFIYDVDIHNVNGWDTYQVSADCLAMHAIRLLLAS